MKKGSVYAKSVKAKVRVVKVIGRTTSAQRRQSPVFSQDDIEKAVSKALGPDIGKAISELFAKPAKKEFNAAQIGQLAILLAKKKKSDSRSVFDGRHYGGKPPKAPVSPKPKAKKK